jgi:hypothetical protein
MSLRRNKINHLLQIWPKGTIATSSWLTKQGIRFDLASRYKKSGWIESIGHGAFKLAGDKVMWHGALYSLQTQLNMSIHVAGKTALGLLGKLHYIPLSGRENVILFSAQGERLPLWFKKNDWNINLRYIFSDFIPREASIGLTKIKEAGFEYTISSAERAILEFLYDVPEKESLEEARLVFEGLMTLRPDVVGELLKLCISVKVKRLFMVLAEMFNHAWLPELNIKQVDFGKGKRGLVHDGFMNSKYQITLPKSWQ